MPERVTIEAAIAQIKSCQPSLIAIDGLPCSGKTTLAELLQRRLEVDYVGLDEFILPEQDWVSRNKPTFPFEFIRYEEFVSAIRSLATIGECSFYPFDFDTLIISQQSRTVTVAKPVVIEGVSSLNPTLCPLYDIRIFVEHLD
jgi:uridine kinase